MENKNLYSSKLLLDMDLAKNIGLTNAMIFSKIKNILKTSKIEVDGVKVILVTINQIIASLGGIYKEKTIRDSLNFLVTNNFLIKIKKSNKIYYGLNSELEKKVEEEKLEIDKKIIVRKTEKQKETNYRDKCKMADRILAQQREKNLQKQEYFQTKANSNQLYKEVLKKKTELEIEWTKAVAFGENTKAKSLFPKLMDANKQLSQVLASIGLTQSMLQVNFDCVKCEDTGFDKITNKRCDCFFKLIDSL